LLSKISTIDGDDFTVQRRTPLILGLLHRRGAFKKDAKKKRRGPLLLLLLLPLLLLRLDDACRRVQNV